MGLLAGKSFLATAAAIILAGVAGWYAGQAYPNQHRVPAMHRQNLNPDQKAQKIADKFGLDKTEILYLFEQGASFRDLSWAAFLAKTGNQSLQEVLTLKTPDKTWRDVAEFMGVTDEQAKAARQQLMIECLAKLNIPRQSAQELLQQGYRPHDIAVAAGLAGNTGKTMNEILGMRTINNTWRDVARALGVNEAVFKENLQKIREVLPHKGGQQGAGDLKGVENNEKKVSIAYCRAERDFYVLSERGSAS